MKPWLFVLIPLFGMPSAWAAGSDADENPAYVACMDKAGGVTGDMMNCIQTETERQDARLNAAYQALRERAQDRKDALRDAQRAWMRYRDANCTFYDDPDGGTLARVAANACVMRMSAERADELEDLARQP